MSKKVTLILSITLVILLAAVAIFSLYFKNKNKSQNSVDFGPKTELKDSQNKMTLKYPESMDVYDIYYSPEEGTKDIFFRFKEDSAQQPSGLVLRIRSNQEFDNFAKYCEVQKGVEIPESCFETSEDDESSDNKAAERPECRLPEYWCGEEAAFSTEKINGTEWEIPAEKSVMTRNGEFVLYSISIGEKVYTMVSKSDASVYLESARQIIESLKFSSK